MAIDFILINYEWFLWCSSNVKNRPLSILINQGDNLLNIPNMIADASSHGGGDSQRGMEGAMGSNRAPARFVSKTSAEKGRANSRLSVSAVQRSEMRHRRAGAFQKFGGSAILPGLAFDIRLIP